VKLCSLLAGDVAAKPPPAWCRGDDENASEYFGAAVNTRATISRAWLWRMHFLKVRFHLGDD
jgi:hypothetical protein